MMQQGAPPQEAPQPQQAPQQEMSPEDQLKEQVMAIVADILDEWKQTGKIEGKRITDEKEAKRTAVAMALKQVEQEKASAQNQAQAAPPQGAPMGGPMGGGGMM